MAYFVVPIVEGEQFFTQELSFDGVQYEMRLRWNERAERWIMNLYLSDGTAVQLGTPVNTEVFLTRLNQSLNAPFGDLFPFDTSGSEDAAELTLGKDVLLYYIENESLVELEAA